MFEVTGTGRQELGGGVNAVREIAPGEDVAADAPAR
jgi:hypothetical protein